ncbi:MAG: NYN domain-containing protein [Bacteroidota bacterium]
MDLISQKDSLIRIGVFYDGNYFAHVSNYYNYEHERKSRLSISGLHEFIRLQVAIEENIDPRYAKIVDSHYFRGRLNANDYAHNGQNRIINERVFDDILMSEGVITHYLPLRIKEGRIEEKGIDVWMALEAFELALHKQYNVLALIACDGDYIPLVRKLNTLGIRVMILGWDFEYTDERTGRYRKTVTSVDLLNEATYPVSMHEIIDEAMEDEEDEDLEMVDQLFIPKEKRPSYSPRRVGNGQEQVLQSTVLSLKNGYGFIHMPPNNLYFHYTWMSEGDFNDLEEDDLVQFTVSQNDKGQDIAVNVRIVE